jgi:hypothetical protein
MTPPPQSVTRQSRGQFDGALLSLQVLHLIAGVILLLLGLGMLTRRIQAGTL